MKKKRKPGTLPPVLPDQIAQIILPNDVLAAIGQLILTCSEIDDLVASAIFKVACIEPIPGLMLLGTTQISAKLDKLQRILELRAHPSFMDAFLKLRVELGLLLKFRNTLAHGVFIGQHKDGYLLFSVPSTIAADQPAIGVDDQSAIIAVPATAVYEIRSLPPESIIQMANQVAPHWLQVMQEMFSLEEPRLAHRARLKAPGSAPPTPLTENSPTEVPPPPPQSSQE
jgi:hypothetical protein